MNQKRIVTISFALLSVLVFFVFKNLLELVWGLLRLPSYDQWPLTPAVGLAVILAALVFFFLEKNIKISAFVNDVVVELGKVTWPQRKETVLSAVVVIVMVGIASVFLFTFDTLWGSLVQVLLSRV